MTGSGFRRRHVVGFAVCLVVLALSIWPLYPWIAGIEPVFLGMPFSMVWLCLMIATVFSTFLAVFIWDREDDRKLDDAYRRGR